MTRYTVVFRDHSGDWHAIAGPVNWSSALAIHSTMIATLAAIDYYDDFPPTVAKIVDGSQAGSAYYAQAPALAEAVKES